MLSPLHAAALREVLRASDYTVDGVVCAIGEAAHRALGRNNTTPAVLVLEGKHEPLATLTKLWPLQQVVPQDDVERALPGLVVPLIEAGVLTGDGVRVRALIDIRPYASEDDHASGWIVSDLSPGLDGEITPIRPDFVLGVSSASTTLAQMAIRRPVRRALDLGSGCGVQSLHLAAHCDEVVAIDLNERAIELSRLTATLSGVDVDFRCGDFFGPVAGEKFDLIVSNPPYVMSPPTAAGQRLVYREGGFVGDGLVEHVVRGGIEHLEPGGTLQVLANWAHREGERWQDRLANWIEGSGCDGHVVQREFLDAAEYIELWLADAGLINSPRYVSEYRSWMRYFDQLQINGVGMGWITLRKTDRSQPRVTLESWPYPIEQPIGPALRARQDAIDLVDGLSDQELLDTCWVLAEDVQQESLGTPGEVDPHHIVFRQQRGLRRAVEMDTALAGVLGACDGELTLEQIIAAVAGLLDFDAAALVAQVVPRVRELAVDQLLSPNLEIGGAAR